MGVTRCVYVSVRVEGGLHLLLTGFGVQNRQIKFFFDSVKIRTIFNRPFRYSAIFLGFGL